jgi:hypothetical protein
MMNLNKKLERLDRASVHSRPKRSWKKIMVKLFVILLIVGLAIYLPARSMYASLKSLKVHAKEVSAAAKNENLDQIKEGLVKTRADVDSLNSSLNWFFYLGLVPYFGGYYLDAKHFGTAASYELDASQTIVNSLDPYKNELGFTGQPIAGQDRIAQLVKVMDKTLPQLDKIEPDLRKAKEAVEPVNTSKYPEKFGSTIVRSRLEAAKNLIIGAHVAITEARPALEIAPSALGATTPKTYLLLFQNDKEIRATGGFLTAYSFVKLDKGHLSTTASDDIYHLDEKLLEVCKNKICPLTPPAPLVKYLPEADGKPRSAWSMRDSNLSPDIPTAAKEFERMYAMLGDNQSFDGIIYIDTKVVEDLIAITGPIDVFGTNFSAENNSKCNCSDVIYELEHYAEVAAQGEKDRKAVLGTLMQQMLGKVLGAGPDKMPEFLNAGVNLANGKHILVYMHDQKTESALSQLGWTGEIKKTDGDYLHINDSNFAGGKSNLYVDQKVTLNIDTSSDQVKHTLTIEYKNPQQFNSWLNGINRDYVRIYVPQGSKLVTSKGSEGAVSSFDELGKTVFEAFITVRPQNSRVLSFEYTTPNPSKTNPYPLLIQKQPGAKDFPYAIKLNGSSKANFDLKVDQDLKL